ncbi:SpoIIE family protein phosphatase [Streptomyces ochraceiscleroticus]|uniref:SpoIIE family protein phosphatase n=1 Tax=Streptomyces ochraceiscleroticus TaxID=47761 RepID=A0ABW1MPL6_9ACTN|nr:SpoIIE family protein phosphatase [Streptomyces ochraceiscleroticus]
MTATCVPGRRQPPPPLLPVSTGVCLLIAVLDALVGVQLVALLVIGPLLACTRLTVRHTALVCCWAILLGAATGLAGGTSLTPSFALRWCGLLAGCALTVYVAWYRTASERALKLLAHKAVRAARERGLRPVSLHLDGTHVCAVRYRRLAQQARSGGGLCDVARTPFGVRIIVGDVQGGGPDAMRLTEAAGAGFRELARTTEDLPGLAAALDAQLSPQLGPEGCVTAVLAEFAPGEVRLVNCGHPAPLRSGRGVDPLEPTVATRPLGRQPDPRQYRCHLRTGERLLFYTAGLSEARDPQGAPFPVLREATAALDVPSAEEALDSLCTRLLLHTGQRPAAGLSLMLCQPTGTAGANRSAAARPRHGSPPGAGHREVRDGWFRTLLKTAPDATVIVDVTGTIQLVNAQAEILFGYQRAELLGRPVETLVPERFRSLHVLHRHGYVHNRQVCPMGAGLDLYGLRRDGTEFPVEISIGPIETADGTLVAVAARDVTDRKSAEERIVGLADLVESSHDAILAKTLDGRITYWNAAAQRLYGYTPEEAIGAHVSMLAPLDRAGEIDELLGQLRRGEKIEHFETLRITRERRRIDVDLTLWPTRSVDGRITGACAIARDVTEQKRATAELTALYEQQRHVALTLQRSLMGTPPEVPGLHTAHRYLPATQGAGVGGDWFDLVPLDAGRVGVLIGDVMGRGLEAAAVMGQLRAAAHALAKSGMPPRELMHTLEVVVADLPDQFVTCCYLDIDPETGQADICSAGHLPVLLVTPDAEVSALPVPVNMPLGVGMTRHEQVRLDLPPGATLVVYTDGLVETPGCDIEDRIDVLARTLAGTFATAPGLEQAADGVLAGLLPDPDGCDDDVTLLLARMPGVPLLTAGRELDAVPAAVPEGRAFLAATLGAWQLAGLTDDARLLTSELLTNAVRHAGGPVRLRLCRTESGLTVEVTDRSPQFPHPRTPGTGDESGRGLTLVDALADSWGTRPAEDGKSVWFTLCAPPWRAHTDGK